MEFKKWFASKTVWFNIITFVLAVLALPETLAILPEGSFQVLALVNALGNLLLRLYFTKTEIK